MRFFFFSPAWQAVIVLEHLTSHSFQNMAVQMQTLMLIMKGSGKGRRVISICFFFSRLASWLVEVWPISTQILVCLPALPPHSTHNTRRMTGYSLPDEIRLFL